MPHPPLLEAVPRATQDLPLEERLERRAYELYVLQGNESGAELDDWLQAEDEIRAEEEQAATHR